MKRISTIALLAVLLLPPFVAAEQIFDGAAHLYNLPEVTVVYPAAPGVEGETNHRSALSRATMLERRHDVRVRVVADDEFTDETLEGHLLVLGWNNRLLSASLLPEPIVVGVNPRQFLGSIPVDAGEDLLFAAPSPYAADRLLVFWSRIDPELDRLMRLPFLGADWGIYRDYRAVAHGNFRSKKKWLPTRNATAEIDRRESLRKAPVRGRSAHFALRGAIDETEVDGILESRERAFSRAAEFLGTPPDGFVIDLFVYKDTDTKNEMTGVHDDAHAIPSKREIHMSQRSARSSSARQETHVLAAQQIGPCRISALCEGLAVDLSLPPGPEGLPVYASLIVENDALPPITDLLNEESFHEMIRRRLGMPSAGLFVRWLLTTGGRETVDRAYVSRALTPADLSGWLEISESALDDRFAAWIQETAAEGQSEHRFRQARAEALQRRADGDPSGAVVAFRRALEIKPADAECLYKLSDALLRASRPDEAEAPLRKLIGLPEADRDASYLLFGHYLLGKTHDALGRKAEAEREFRRVLDLPDRFGAHEKARQALAEQDGKPEVTGGAE